MRITVIFFIALIALISSSKSSSQDIVTHETIFPEGASINYGIGHFSIRDEYISTEKYSGTLPSIAASWSRFHNKHGFHQKLEYRRSSEIRNNNISTDIIQFSLHRDYLYPLGELSLFSKDFFPYLGPSTEFFLLFNNPNYIEGGIHLNYSFVVLLSGGINSGFIVPLQHGFQIESSAYLSLLSIGLRTPEIIKPKENENDEEESVAKLLTPFTGLNADVSFGIRYYFNKSLSVKLAYKFHLTRIQSWDPFLSASDNLILSLTYKFKKRPF